MGERILQAEIFSDQGSLHGCGSALAGEHAHIGSLLLNRTDDLI